MYPWRGGGGGALCGFWVDAAELPALPSLLLLLLILYMKNKLVHMVMARNTAAPWRWEDMK